MTRWLAAAVAWAAGLHAADAHAAGARIAYDTSEARVAFAARELEAALRARGYAAEHRPLAEAARSPGAPAEPSLHILLMTREQARQRGAANAAPGAAYQSLRPEGFALLQAGSASARELWVVGADVAGEMYGGLELAE
jgi:hypothetical protein